MTFGRDEQGEEEDGENRGKRASSVNRGIKEFYEVAIDSFMENNNGKKPTQKQIQKSERE